MANSIIIYNVPSLKLNIEFLFILYTVQNVKFSLVVRCNDGQLQIKLVIINNTKKTTNNEKKLYKKTKKERKKRRHLLTVTVLVQL